MCPTYQYQAGRKNVSTQPRRRHYNITAWRKRMVTSEAQSRTRMEPAPGSSDWHKLMHHKACMWRPIKRMDLDLCRLQRGIAFRKQPRDLYPKQNKKETFIFLSLPTHMCTLPRHIINESQAPSSKRSALMCLAMIVPCCRISRSHSKAMRIPLIGPSNKKPSRTAFSESKSVKAEP